jgi:hypothetical protein
MRHFIWIFFFASSLLLCTSCKKDKSDFPVSLHFTNITQNSKIRLFANKIEIKDESVISKFVKASPEIYYIQNEMVKHCDNLSFFSADSAKLGIDQKSFAVSKNGDLILFTPKGAPSPISNTNVYDLMKYTTPKIQVSSNNVISYVSKFPIVAHGTYNRLAVSLTSYKIIKSNPNGVPVLNTLGAMLNEFNPTFINQLGTYDTLAVQEASINLNVK